VNRQILVLFSVLLAGCAIADVGGVIHPAITGALTITDSDGSQTHWAPDRCVSGDLAYFAGFDFLSSHDTGHLRAALNPIDGPVVRWSRDDASGRFLIARRGDCILLDIDVQPTIWRVNEVREFAGHVAIECSLPNGVRLGGRVDVDHCH